MRPFEVGRDPAEGLGVHPRLAGDASQGRNVPVELLEELVFHVRAGGDGDDVEQRFDGHAGRPGVLLRQKVSHFGEQML